MTAHRLPRSSSGRSAQRGAVLYVALTVLVALALAALALLRSVDIVGLVADNLSLKRSALNSTDLGTQQALDAFNTLNASHGLFTTPPNGCYSAVIVGTDSRGVPTLLNDLATFDAAHPSCKLIVPITGTGASTGESVRFYIDRQCSKEGNPSGELQVSGDPVCTLSTKLPVFTNTSSPQPIYTVLPLYRITVRTDRDSGRNATSYVQVIFKPT